MDQRGEDLVERRSILPNRNDLDARLANGLDNLRGDFTGVVRHHPEASGIDAMQVEHAREHLEPVAVPRALYLNLDDLSPERHAPKFSWRAVGQQAAIGDQGNQVAVLR